MADIYVETPTGRHLLLDDVRDLCECADGKDLEFTPKAMALLSCMLNGDPLVLKEGYLFHDNKPQCTLYGQRFEDMESYRLLRDGGCIEQMEGGPSPAITQYRVSTIGVLIFQGYRKLRERLYADA